MIILHYLQIAAYFCRNNKQRKYFRKKQNNRLAISCDKCRIKKNNLQILIS